MVNQQIKESNFSNVKAWENAVCLDNDLVLTKNIHEAPIPTSPLRMNFIVIGLCTKGQLIYQLDGIKQVIRPGDILIVSERHVVDNYEPSPDMRGLCIMMSINFYHEIVQNVRDVSSLFLFSHSHPVMQLESNEVEIFKEYFHVIMQRTSDQGNHFRRDLVRTLLLAMLYDLSNVIFRVVQTIKPRNRAETIFTQFIRLVEDNCKQERRVCWYAEQLCITPKYLSETIKSTSRRTPNEWIDNYVIMELRVLLKNTNKSIKEITDELNFPNQSFLGKYFKEHMGMSPSKYRKS